MGEIQNKENPKNKIKQEVIMISWIKFKFYFPISHHIRADIYNCR